MAKTDMGAVGFNLVGTWNAQLSYERLSLVAYNGGSYVARKTVPAGTTLADASYWMPVSDTRETVQQWLDAHPEATTTVVDGSITAAKLASDLSQQINSSTAGVLSLDGRADALEGAVSQHETDLDVLDARMAQIEAGTTPEGSEITDVRVGYDGTTYATAGEAVREQVGDLNETLYREFDHTASPPQILNEIQIGSGWTDIFTDMPNDTWFHGYGNSIKTLLGSGFIWSLPHVLYTVERHLIHGDSVVYTVRRMNGTEMYQGYTIASSTSIVWANCSPSARVNGNLFFPQAVVHYCYVSISAATRGQLVDSANSNTSGWISVTPGDILTLAMSHETLATSTNRQMIFYDASRQYLSSTSVNPTLESQQITVPDKAAFMRFSFDIHNYGIELVTSSTVDTLARTQLIADRDAFLAVDPALEWEQGTFATSVWTKTHTSTYSKYVRLRVHPSLAGVSAVKVTVNAPCTYYIAFKGQDAAASSTNSAVYKVPAEFQTEFNITLYNGGAQITPEFASSVSVQFMYSADGIRAALLDKLDSSEKSVRAEMDGIIIADETTSIRIGLYGASIVAGYGVSDYAEESTGDFVDMGSIGYSARNFNKYVGDLSWANQLKAYIEGKFPNVTVENWAVSGATSETYYDYLVKSINNGNSPLKTDVDIAIVMMGNNGRGSPMPDNISGFTNIIRLLQERGAEVYFLTPTAAFNTKSDYVLNTYQIMHCTKEAARETGAFSVDAFHWIQDYCDMMGISIDYSPAAEKNFLKSDRLHPSDLGQSVIFKAVRSLLKV